MELLFSKIIISVGIGWVVGLGDADGKGQDPVTGHSWEATVEIQRVM